MQADGTHLSVIIPVLDEADSLPALLDDLQPLRAAGHQLIVVDGGSSDASRDLARPRVDLLLQAPAGRALQMNRGAAAASGNVLWFLHADSRVEPASATAILVNCSDRRPWGRFDVRLSGDRPAFRVIERLMNLRSCLSGIATGDQGIFVRRDTYDAVGGYPAIRLMEDIALSRGLRRSYRPCCIHEPRLQTSSRRWERRGILRTVLLMWRLRLGYALGVSPDRLEARYR